MGLKYAGARAKVFQRSSSRLCREQLFTKNYFFCALTPELSRAALRPWASETCKNLHEAAKRARLERIVRFDSDELVGLQFHGNLLALLARRSIRFDG